MMQSPVATQDANSALSSAQCADRCSAFLLSDMLLAGYNLALCRRVLRMTAAVILSFTIRGHWFDPYTRRLLSISLDLLQLDTTQRHYCCFQNESQKSRTSAFEA